MIPWWLGVLLLLVGYALGLWVAEGQARDRRRMEK